VRFYVRRVDHLRLGGSSVASKLAEKVFPNAAPRPTNKSVIDGRGRTVFGRAIAPTASDFQNMDDAADDATIIRSLDTSHIPR